MKKYVIQLPFNGSIQTTLNNEGKSYYTGLTVEQMSEKDNINYIAITNEELDAYLEEYYNKLTSNDWKEITEDEYYEAYECLPPMNYRCNDKLTIFCISEATTAHLHSYFVKYKDNNGKTIYKTALRSCFISSEEIVNQLFNN